jgi:hypothetical protein
LFISKNSNKQRLKYIKELESYKELMDYLKKGEYDYDSKLGLAKEFNQIKDKLQKETIPFSTYYAERLEWWEKKFDKKPERHGIIVKLINGTKIKRYINGNLVEATNDYVTLCNEIKQLGTLTIEDKNYGTIMKEAILSIDIFEGHPESYSDSEIEQWAKEQLDKEVQNWRVVKENDGIKIPYDNHLTHINGLSTNISGD